MLPFGGQVPPGVGGWKRASRRAGFFPFRVLYPPRPRQNPGMKIPPLSGTGPLLAGVSSANYKISTLGN